MRKNGWNGDTYGDELPSSHDNNINSTNTDPKYSYAQQAETVRACLQGSFGKYTNEIPLINSFFGELDFFMNQLQASYDYKGEKIGEEYEEIMNDVILGDNAINQYIGISGKNAIDNMKKNLVEDGKSEKEAMDIIHERMNLFVELLKKNIRFKKRD